MATDSSEILNPEPRTLNPSHSDRWATFYCGHVVEVLSALPDESVHCAVTSPPYWGLRDYGIPPTIWGGRPDCEHEWGEQCGQVDRRRDNAGLLESGTGSPETRRQGLETRQSCSASQGQFCNHCRAWRGCLGLEPTPELYVEHLVVVFRELKRVLRSDGTLWLNLGDCYVSGQGGRQAAEGKLPLAIRRDRPEPQKRSDVDVCGWSERAVTPRTYPSRQTGLKPKDLVGLPWMVAFALRADGWYLWSDIVWAKPNPMPESIRDRPTKAHEYVFLLSKAPRYFYDRVAIGEKATQHGEIGPGNKEAGKAGEPGAGGYMNRRAFFRPECVGVLNRNKRSVWTIATQPYPEAHFATYPEKLVEPCILAGTSERGVCPVCGAPWRRIVERVRRATRPGEKSKVYPRPDGWATGADHTAIGHSRRDRGETGNRDPGRHVTEEVTLGWYPTCQCHGPDQLPDLPKRRKGESPEDYAARYEPVRKQVLELIEKWDHLETLPATVLDPFLGSGTTAAVAKRLGRLAVGIEINPKYLELAVNRQPDQAALF